MSHYVMLCHISFDVAAMHQNFIVCLPLRMFWFIVGIVAALLVLVLIHVFLVAPLRFIRFYRSQGIGGLPFKLFSGSVKEIQQDLARTEPPFFRFSIESREQFGPVYYQLVGPMPRLVVVDPVLIGDVYGRLNNMYSKPGFMKDILSTLLGKGLVTSEGDLWKQQRHVINPAFTFSNIEKMIPLMVECTRLAFEQWSTKCQQTGSFEMSIHEELSSVTLDIIGGAAFGISFASSSELKTTFYRSLAGILDMIERRFMNLTGLLPVIKHLPISSKRFIDTTCVKLKALVDQFIADRKSGRTRPQCCDVDLLQLLLDARYDDGSSMDVKQVRDEAMTFVLAGHETTSSLLTWLLYQTSIQPEIWEQCKAEVDNELQGQLPDADNVKRLELIDSVLHETLRFWPPVPMTSREATVDHTIGGHDGARELKIAKGTTVVVLANPLHRDPKLWENPDVFDPQRFLRKTEHNQRRHIYQYVPFGGGKRMCIGSAFALLEAKIIFSMMLQRFELSLVPAQLVCPVVAITMRPRYGLQMVCRPAPNAQPLAK